MSENKFETAVGMCVVALTKHIMFRQGINQEAAYRKLIRTELFKLLGDIETRLYIETNAFLCEALDKELYESVDAMYNFINN